MLTYTADVSRSIIQVMDLTNSQMEQIATVNVNVNRMVNILMTNRNKLTVCLKIMKKIFE